MLKARRRARERRTENKSELFNLKCCFYYFWFLSTLLGCFIFVPSVDVWFCLARISVFNDWASPTTSIISTRTFGKKSSRTMKMQFSLRSYYLSNIVSRPAEQAHSTCLRVLRTCSEVATVHRRNVSFRNGWDEKLMTFFFISDRKRKHIKLVTNFGVTF